MGTPDGRERMLERHEIVLRIIDANSRRLRSENELNGLDIERRVAERDLSADPENVELVARLADLTNTVAALQDDRKRIEAERDWLDQALADLDSASSRAAQKSGRA